MNIRPPLKQIPVPAGPEDMGLISIEGRDQILVSSTPRRGTVLHSIQSVERGAFSLMDPATDELREVAVRDAEGEPMNPFCPHGIHVDPVENVVVAVSHEPTDAAYQYADHALVLAYRDNAFQLLHRSAIEVMGGRIGNNDANDIVYRNGVVFVSMLSSNCVAYAKVPTDGADWAWKQLEDIRLANGMEFHDGALLVCSSLPGTINAFPLDADGLPTGERKRLKQLGGVLDNFTRGPGEVLHLAAIAHPIRYLMHSVVRWITSPTRFYEVRLGETLSAREILLKGGKRLPIQTGSTLLRYGDAYYCSQVFDPWVLKVPIDQVEYVER